MLRRAAKSFPIGTGLGGDNISPRAIDRRSDKAITMLARLYRLAEWLGTWPALMHLILIVLLPKPDGGRRPIGLFPTLIRVWMRARVDIAKAWDAAHQIAGCFGGPGMGAQRAAWQAAYRSEVAAQDGLHFAQSLLDLVKAFEKIPHEHIQAAAIKHGYCLCTLLLSLASYKLPQTI